MTFYDKIKNLMIETKTTQKELSDNLGINKNSFLYWKKNGNIPKGDIIQSLANYFDCSTDYLLGISDTKKQTPHDGQPVSDDLEELMKVSSSLSPDNLFLLRKLAEQLVDKQNQGES